MLPVTVSPGVFKTQNDRQSEFNKKCEAIKQIFMVTSQTLAVLLVYTGLSRETFVELKGEVDTSVRQEPTYIKININIKFSNANKIVMLSKTHGYNQFVRFRPLKQLKVLILPVH